MGHGNACAIRQNIRLKRNKLTISWCPLELDIRELNIRLNQGMRELMFRGLDFYLANLKRNRIVQFRTAFTHQKIYSIRRVFRKNFRNFFPSPLPPVFILFTFSPFYRTNSPTFFSSFVPPKKRKRKNPPGKMSKASKLFSR